MESAIARTKIELINRRGPWRTLADVELATAPWAHWYNKHRIHSEIGNMPPDEGAWLQRMPRQGKHDSIRV